MLRSNVDPGRFQSRIAHFAFLVFMDTPPHDVAKRTRQGGKKASEAHAQWHQGAEALVKRFRYQGNFLEVRSANPSASRAALTGCADCRRDERGRGVRAPPGLAWPY